MTRLRTHLLLTRLILFRGQDHRENGNQQGKPVGVHRVGEDANAVQFESVFQGQDQFDPIDEHPRERGE